jgi:hypothetical protein
LLKGSAGSPTGLFTNLGVQAVSLQTEQVFREQLKIAPSRDIGEIK